MESRALVFDRAHRVPRISGGHAQAMLKGSTIRLAIVTETRIEARQYAGRILSIFGGEIVLVTAYYAPSHLERFRVGYVPRLQDFGIERTRGLEFAHVLELGKIE